MLGLHCDSCHISVHLKKIHKTGEFCIAVLILKVEEKSNVFGMLCFIISRKIKNTTEMHKKRFVQCMEKGAVTDRTCQKWRAKFHAGDFAGQCSTVR